MMPKFELFGLTVSTYALMAVLAAITFSVMSWRPLRSCALPLPGVIILLISVCTAFLIGARLWNVAVRPDSYDAEKPWYTLKMSGFSVFGGITGVAVVVLSAALISRIQPLKLLDAVTVPGAAAFCIARVGCFLGGCCYGKETDLPWGVVFPQADSVSASLTNVHPVHPTQLYELILALLGIPLCLFVVKKVRAGEGGLFFIYGVWFCTLRLAVHPLRAFPYSPVVTNIVYPLLYYVLIVLCVFLFVWSCRKNRSDAGSVQDGNP